MGLILATLCAISSNLDTLGVSIAYGIKKIDINFNSALIISVISTLGTYLSMLLGLLIAQIINSKYVDLAGSIALIAIGIWFIVEPFYRRKLFSTKILDSPEIADIDASGNIDIKESLVLAFALTVNNVGVGIAASTAGVDIYSTTIMTFIFTFIALKLGSVIGSSYFSKFFGKYSSIFSGLLMLLIGAYEICF